MIQFECESHDQGWGGNSNYQMHVKLYSENDEIVQKYAPGSTLELVLCAQYPGWSNTAKYGRIAIYY